MSDRITRSVSGSSSDSEAGESSDDVSGHDSSLGATGQDRDGRSGESGSGGRSSSSLTSPGHVESRELGAKPRKKTEGREGKGSKHTGKGVVWDKKDRKGAKFYRGKGQMLAAERAARDAAEGAAKAAKAAAEGKGKEDGSGLVALRAVGPRTKHHHGRKTDSHHGGTTAGRNVLGKAFSGFIISVAMLLGPLSALLSLISLLSSDTSVNNTQESTSSDVTKTASGGGYSPQTVFMVAYLFISICVIAFLVCTRGSSNKDKKHKR
ncbi:hypothetical protein [Candidatus Ichthyocystis hellenicum]|uniref:hypothetical protein n=1 Tax=Candidatus Ichthyocystis hellenicum TaxID=1561003 RepID=UPI000B855AB2|nr:hypothetical protein [Candidatus Ichthyocystis hellenicum]